MYVADTGNHAIRMISPSGNVSTIAGTGLPGFTDGDKRGNGVLFSSPSGIAVWRDWSYHRDGRIVLYVADTGNHRIRKITGDMEFEQGTGEKKMVNVMVECFSGYCDKNPQAGFADGTKNQSRFDSPVGIVITSHGDIFVTDTNNHLIRKIDMWGVATTLAGKLVLSEMNEEGERLEGCPDPCLTGLRGQEDGHVESATFSFPNGVALTPNEKFLLVTNKHILRMVDIHQEQVKTIAGGYRESERDGQGLQASFNKPSGITVTGDGIAYLVDSSSCRIRRVTTPELFVPTIKCTDTIADIFRPSGCSSYDTQIDDHGFKATPQSGNIQYNYLYYNWTHVEVGEDFVGRGIKDCVGSPPIALLDKLDWNESAQVIDNNHVSIREDPNEGSLVRVACRDTCSSIGSIYGVKIPSPSQTSSAHSYVYSEESSICLAAEHAGLLQSNINETILIDVILHRPTDSNLSTFFKYSTRYGDELLSSIPETHQFYSLRSTSRAVVVQTIAGAPTVLRGKSCGYVDSIPAQEAKVCMQDVPIDKITLYFK